MKKLNKILAMFLAIVTLACSINITSVQAKESSKIVTETKTLKHGETERVNGVQFDVGGTYWIDIVDPLTEEERIIYNLGIVSELDTDADITVSYYSSNGLLLDEINFNLKAGKFTEYEMPDGTSEVKCTVSREDVVKEQKKTTTDQPMQVQAKQTDKVVYDKHGEIDGVAYGVRLCNTKSKEDDFEYKLGTKLTCCETMLRNTNNFPVRVKGEIVYYKKNNKKLETKTFETYLYANQRKMTGAGVTMLASSGLAKCKITYKATKVSLKTINEKLKYESDGVYWGGCYSGVKYETSLYNVPLKDGHNDLGKKHYSDRNDKKQAYIKDFDYDKSTGTFTFTIHYTKKITYKAHNLGWGATNGNINIEMELYDKDGYWIGGEYFSESLVGETFVKGDTATITGTIDVNDLYGVDSLDDIATIDLAFANTFYK